MPINSSDIAKLRAQTGAGMMDVKHVLEEAGGDMEKATDLLRQRGAVKAAKWAEKVAAEGVVASYIHAGGRVGVLVEVNCETDFVAKNERFQQLVKDIAMQIAATAPKYVAREGVPAVEIEREKDVYRAQLKHDGKQVDIIEKIIEGKMAKYYSEVCLLDQPFIKDEDRTMGRLLVEKSGEMGEKIIVRRFTRYGLGEGIEKEAVNFVDEVMEQAAD